MAVWHPFFQHGAEPAPPCVVRTDGAYLHTADGRRLFDAISSWWVTTHGHCHPRITAAIRATAESMDQVIFAGLTHGQGEALARALVGLAPPGFSHAFFSDSGSTAVEVAVKMAVGARNPAAGGPHRVAVMEGGYHGDTIGAMSLGARGVFNARWEPLLFSVDTLPFPAPGREDRTLQRFRDLLRDGGLAALVVEPLVLGAGGMRMYAPAVLRDLAALAAEHGVLLVADEVMTGWGRTGTLWACEQAGVSPDLLCTSKGLTGGAVPLAATLAKPAVFDAYRSPDRGRAFFHSSSYTANPIACAAALANIDIWREEPVLARVAAVAEAAEALRARFAEDGRFAGARRCGTITAMELRGDAGGYLAEVGPRLRAACLRRDVLLRPLGDTLYVMPPYCATGDELARVGDVISEAVAECAT